ncbi:MAG TPA: (d)CMP kinase [Candidatus Saccharimonadia bacterium]|nr:(d)CMP kinase [Candidatus Saccharimonadia bacterium]
MGGLPRIIAIDGSTRTGKSTVARIVATQLCLPHLNTGLVYRAVGWLALNMEIDADDPTAESVLVRQINAFLNTGRFEFVDSDRFRAGFRVLSDKDLRNAEVTAASSVWAAMPGVRSCLVELQRRVAADGAVLEGRDIGTVIFPDTAHKFFLSVSPEERWRRAVERDGEAAALTDQERDERETSRAIAPLRPAEDALVIDTSKMSVAEVAELILDWIDNG